LLPEWELVPGALSGARMRDSRGALSRDGALSDTYATRSLFHDTTSAESRFIVAKGALCARVLEQCGARALKSGRNGQKYYKARRLNLPAREHALSGNRKIIDPTARGFVLIKRSAGIGCSHIPCSHFAQSCPSLDELCPQGKPVARREIPKRKKLASEAARSS